MFPVLFQFALVLFLLAIGLFFFALRHRKYWRQRGLPGPTPHLISGNLDSLFWSNIGIFQLREWTKQFGKVYGIQFGWRNMMVTSDPAMVHELLVSKFEYFHGRNIGALFGDMDTDKWVHLFGAHGARWKRLRAIANPAFSVSNLKKIMPTMDDSIKIFVGLLEKARVEGKPVDMHRHFVEMTFDVIARVALGQRDSQQFRSDKADMAIRSFQRMNNNIFEYLSWLCPWFGHHFLHKYIEWTGTIRRDPVDLLRNKLGRELKERKEQRERGQRAPGAFVDFIDLFLEQETEQQLGQKQNGLFHKAAHGVEKKNTTEEIVMQLLLFLFAGFDTTASSLTIVCFNLLNHPEVQERVQEEIDSICVDEDPTYEQLNQLKYTEAVIKETLRLSPIGASVINRVCAKTTTLCDHTVEKGTAVQVDSISLHRDKNVWGEDADQFRPERWLEDGHLQLPPSYAFGGGPRICIGMRLAMVEERLALVRILRKYSIVRCPETPGKLQFTGQIVFNPTSLYVGLKLREEEEKEECQ